MTGNGATKSRDWEWTRLTVVKLEACGREEKGNSSVFKWYFEPLTLKLTSLRPLLADVELP